MVGKTSLGMICKTIGNSGWWVSQLGRHVQEIPGLSKWSENLLSQSADLTHDSLDTLSAICTDMALMHSSLRASRIEEPKKGLLALLARLGDSVEQTMLNQGCFSIELLKKLQVILCEFIAVFLGQPQLHDLHGAFGDICRQAQNLPSWENCRTHCTAFTHTSRRRRRRRRRRRLLLLSQVLEDMEEVFKRLVVQKLYTLKSIGTLCQSAGHHEGGQVSALNLSEYVKGSLSVGTNVRSFQQPLNFSSSQKLHLTLEVRQAIRERNMRLPTVGE
eukprot:2833402-Amphidinium_carterae.1